tara:strand:- start:2038 stop:3528 length:1491 start_codon:yes stop_codon:yes gene_type:complete
MLKHAKLNLSIALFFILIMYVNLFLFIYLTSNPYVYLDAWFEIQIFLIDFWESGSLQIQDLYRVRSFSSHAHPLHRLLLIANAIVFGLDFKIEALFGSLFLLGILFILLKHLTDISKILIFDWRASLAIVALSATIINLNTTTSFLWSLVTLGYISIFITICFFVHFSNKIIHNKNLDAVSLLLILLMLFIGDTSGIVAAISAIIISSIFAIFSKSIRLWLHPFAVCISLILYLLWRDYILTLSGTPELGSPLLKGGIASPTLLSGIQYFISNPEEILPSILTPFSESFISRKQLYIVFGSSSLILTNIIGVFILSVHAWCICLYIRCQMYKKTLLPLFLLLFAYGLILGIIFYRIPIVIQGSEYLHNERYGRTFQVTLWSCGFIMAYYMLNTKYPFNLKKHLITIASICFLILQFGFIYNAWQSRSINIKLQEKSADQIRYIAGHLQDEVPCNSSTFCDFDLETQQRLTMFLRNNKLNFFNPNIIERQQKGIIQK